MHSVKMRLVATHVAWSVCLVVTTVSPTKTDERIQMLLARRATNHIELKIFNAEEQQNNNRRPVNNYR